MSPLLRKLCWSFVVFTYSVVLSGKKKFQFEVRFTASPKLQHFIKEEDDVIRRSLEYKDNSLLLQHLSFLTAKLLEKILPSYSLKKQQQNFWKRYYQLAKQKGPVCYGSFSENRLRFFSIHIQKSFPWSGIQIENALEFSSREASFLLSSQKLVFWYWFFDSKSLCSPLSFAPLHPITAGIYFALWHHPWARVCLWFRPHLTLLTYNQRASGQNRTWLAVCWGQGDVTAPLSATTLLPALPSIIRCCGWICSI